MTPAAIIDQADRRTERRGPKVLDLKTEFASVLTDFCLRYRWNWRRVSCTFSTVAGLAIYDLSNEDQITDGFVEFAVPEKFLQDGVKLFTSSTAFVCLSPIFEESLQDALLQDTTQGQPTAYFMQPGGPNVIRLVYIPDAVYTVRASFWATPLVIPDELPTTVPLVPPFLHPLLVKGLEVQILRYLIGEGSAKYIAANKEYELGLERAYGSHNFADGRIIEFRDRGNEAIQSTGGGDWGRRIFTGRSSSGAAASSDSGGAPVIQHPLSGALDGVNVIFFAADPIPTDHFLFGDGDKLVQNDPNGYTIVTGHTIICAHPPRTLELYY